VGGGLAKLTNGFGNADMQKFYAEQVPKWFDAFHQLIPKNAFLPLIGTADLAGGIGLFIPGVSKLANLLLIPVMIGAVYSHFRADDAMGSIPAAVIVIALIALYHLKQQPAHKNDGEKKNE